MSISTLADLDEAALRLLFRVAGQAGIDTSLHGLKSALELLLVIKTQLPPTTPVSALATWFAPTLCSSAHEQQVFYAVFEDWCASTDLAAATAVSAVSEQTAASAVDEQRLRDVQNPLRWMMAAGVLLVFVVAAALLVTWIEGVAEVVLYQPEAREPVFEQAGDQVRTAQPASGASYAPALFEFPEAAELNDFLQARTRVNALSSVPLVLFLVWFAWRARRLGVWRFNQAEIREPVFAVPGGATDVWRGGASMKESLRRFRARELIETRELDAARTVDATARKGTFTAVYGTRKIRLETLVLIQSLGAQDQFASLSLALVERMRQEGALVHCYFFEDDLRRIRDVQGEWWNLHALAATFADCRLLLMGEARVLLDELTGEPASVCGQLALWRERAMLTPETWIDWTATELRVREAGFELAPLDERGVDIVSRALGSRGEEDPEVRSARRVALEIQMSGTEDSSLLTSLRTPILPDEAPALVRTLEERLDTRSLHILRLSAVLPKLSWQQTRFLAERAFPDGAIPDLSALCRLHWFRTGQIPDAVRHELLAALSKEDRDQVRRWLLRHLFDRLVPGADPDSLMARRADSKRRWFRDVVAASPRMSWLRDPLFRSTIGGGLRWSAGVSFADGLARIFSLNRFAERPREFAVGLLVVLLVSTVVNLMLHFGIEKSFNMGVSPVLLEAHMDRMNAEATARTIKEFHGRRWEPTMEIDFISRVLLDPDVEDPRRLLANAQYTFRSREEADPHELRLDTGWDKRQFELLWDGDQYVVDGDPGNLYDEDGMLAHMSARDAMGEVNFDTSVLDWTSVRTAVAGYLGRYNAEQETSLVLDAVDAISIEPVTDRRFVAYVGYHVTGLAMGDSCVIRPFTIEVEGAGASQSGGQSNAGLKVIGMGLGQAPGVIGNEPAEFATRLTPPDRVLEDRIFYRALPDSEGGAVTWLHAVFTQGCGGAWRPLDEMLLVPAPPGEAYLYGSVLDKQWIFDCEGCDRGTLTAVLPDGRTVSRVYDLDAQIPDVVPDKSPVETPDSAPETAS